MSIQKWGGNHRAKFALSGVGSHIEGERRNVGNIGGGIALFQLLANEGGVEVLSDEGKQLGSVFFHEITADGSEPAEMVARLDEGILNLGLGAIGGQVLDNLVHKELYNMRLGLGVSNLAERALGGASNDFVGGAQAKLDAHRGLVQIVHKDRNELGRVLGNKRAADTAEASEFAANVAKNLFHIRFGAVRAQLFSDGANNNLEKDKTQANRTNVAELAFSGGGLNVIGNGINCSHSFRRNIKEETLGLKDKREIFKRNLAKG
jgi:hypothetical protein